MEIYLVYIDDEGYLVVVGLFVKEGFKNKVLEDFWENFFIYVVEYKYSVYDCNIVELLLVEKIIYYYFGLFIILFCLEGVEWFLVE